MLSVCVTLDSALSTKLSLRKFYTCTHTHRNLLFFFFLNSGNLLIMLPLE